MKKNLVIFLSAIFLGNLFYGCGGGGESTSDNDPPIVVTAKEINSETSITNITTRLISATTGGFITEENVGGKRLNIPAGAFTNDSILTIGSVNNPPGLPVGLNFVGIPIDLGPDGTSFLKPGTIEIPFTDQELDFAGVIDKTSLKLYIFDKSSNAWSEAEIISIDIVNNVVIGKVNHFSFYALVGLSGSSPADLGRPQPGDLLFKLSRYPKSESSGWVPGHVGIYTGEKTWNGDKKDFASEDVIRCGKYNVVEPLWDGVMYSYYKIPNTVQSCEVQKVFSGESVYMGAREPKDFELNLQQRLKIIEFAEAQIGKSYVRGQTYGVLFGLLSANIVKGPDRFNCVGLVEAAYEYAKTNLIVDYYHGLIAFDYDDTISPSMQYSRTKPAGGSDVGPIINWAKLTPDSGAPFIPITVQISVSHMHGLNQIDSVKYISDSGYVNPTININDLGTNGDLIAGDGIYSFSKPIGGDSSDVTSGFTFTVIDKYGKSDSVRLIYTYVKFADAL